MEISGDRIYRVVSVLQFPEGTKYAGDIPYALPEGVRMDYPQLKKVAALVGEYNVTMQADQTRFSEKEGVFWAEPSFLQLFHFPCWPEARRFWPSQTPSC